MGSQYILGLDLGTSSCKSIIIDETGEVIASHTESYPVNMPHPGWVEQDPRDWWRAAKSSIKGVLKKSGINTEWLAGVGLSGQMHSLVPLDKNMDVLRPAILWNDQRTQRQCEWIHRLLGGKEELIKLTNNPMLPGYTGGKILWMREKEPDLYEKVWLILNPKDYIRYLLTGEKATDVSDASGTGLFDVKNRRWSQKLLSILDLSQDLLPPCFESTEITGKVSEIAANETGLPPGLSVVAGGGDAVIQTTGMGLLKEGILGTILGTSGIVAMGLSGFQYNSSENLQIFCNNSPQAWHMMGVTLAAGQSYRWFKDTFCEAQSSKARLSGKNVYEILDAIASAAPPGSRGLIYLPYLNGERCPYTDPHARGSFIGFTLRHGLEEAARAVLEGVVFSLYHVFEKMAQLKTNLVLREIRTSGGGSASPLWRQIQADVFKVPVKTVRGSREGGAYGAAIVAGTGCGVWKDIDEALKELKTEAENLPNLQAQSTYEDNYRAYKELYPKLSPIFKQLSSNE